MPEDGESVASNLWNPGSRVCRAKSAPQCWRGLAGALRTFGLGIKLPMGYLLSSQDVGY